MATITEPTIGAPPPLKPGPPRGGGGDNSGGPDQSRSGTTARIAVYIGMVASTMTFTALLSAMFVRRGLATNNDWHRLAVPPLLWWNTAALLLSSVAIDIGRRAFRAGRRREFRMLWLTGTALGTWFLIGQAINWKFLVRSRLLHAAQSGQRVLLCADLGARRACDRSARSTLFRSEPDAVLPLYSPESQCDGSERYLLAFSGRDVADPDGNLRFLGLR